MAAFIVSSTVKDALRMKCATALLEGAPNLHYLDDECAIALHNAGTPRAAYAIRIEHVKDGWDQFVDELKGDPGVFSSVSISNYDATGNKQVVSFPVVTILLLALGISNPFIIRRMHGRHARINERDYYVMLGSMVRNANGMVAPGQLLGRSWSAPAPQGAIVTHQHPSAQRTPAITTGGDNAVSVKYVFREDVACTDVTDSNTDSITVTWTRAQDNRGYVTIKIPATAYCVTAHNVISLDHAVSSGIIFMPLR